MDEEEIADTEFDIDVDSLDAGGLDGMDLDQDDDPFESDPNKN